MFTGIIEAQGIIKKMLHQGRGAQITLQSSLPIAEIGLGDSIAVDGVCLTVTAFAAGGFVLDISPETLQRTTLKVKRERDVVNLERALRLSDRLGGHLVSGHIDGIGTIKSIARKDNASQMDFSAPREVLEYIVAKGSVAVDGISLTVNQCDAESFSVMIIPFTASQTTLRYKKVGDTINIENDLIGKYVKKFLLKDGAAGSGITRELLEKFNFS